jgi:aminoglycoside phosphotransferase (APT) family kinase protein
MRHGVAADRGPGPDSALAADVGRALAQLHRVDTERVPSAPDLHEDAPWHRLASELSGVAEVVSPLLGGELAAQAAPYLEGRVAIPPAGGERRFIHDDICPDHLLVDPETGRLTAIIDFGDAIAGDPVHDFVGLIGVGGWAFVADALAAYDLPLDQSFTERLIWLARALTLRWLAEAAVHDPGEVDKHRRWVRSAFATPPPALG